jgi:O-acetyl-ADP-ribose deacetylase (regulator of RNase III)
VLQFERIYQSGRRNPLELIRATRLKVGVELRLMRGDLTQSEADVIVNAANERLRHGAGVAGAIVRRGGAIIQRESNAWVREHGLISHDKPALTTSGDLPSKAVIHVVGPRWGEGDEDRKLSLAVIAALEMARDRGFKSIAFPAISTGIFGFPMERAAKVMLRAIFSFFENLDHPTTQHVDLILFDQTAAKTFSNVLQAQRS